MKPQKNWLNIAYSALSGALFAITFPKFSFYYIEPIALIPLFTVLLNQKKTNLVLWSMLNIWVFGFIFQLIAFFWVSQPIIYFSGLPDYIGYPLFVVISMLTACYFIFLFSPIVVFNWIQYKYPNRTNIPAYLIALLITALEIIIPRFFNWSIGQLFKNIYFDQLSSIFGFNTGSFFIVFINFTLAYAFLNIKNFSLFKRTLLINLCLWAGIFIFGYIRIEFISKKIENAAKIRIGYIQPNFTFQELASKRIHAKNAHEISLGTVIQMSSTVIADSLAYDHKRPDLLVWPESTAPDLIFMTPKLQEIVRQYSQTWQVPILVQDIIRKQKNPSDNYTSIWSVSKIITENGLQSDQFEKWIPIPFGEELPLERIFPKIGQLYRSLIQNSSKVEVGMSYQALNVQNKFFVAPLICFDSIYQKLPHLQATLGNADIFINQANFMWMVNSAAGFAFSYLDKARAIENARSMFLVSNTGPTIAFDPLGRTLYGPTELMSSASGFVDLPIYNGKTLFSYVYNWPILVLAVIGIYRLALRLRSKSS